MARGTAAGEAVSTCPECGAALPLSAPPAAIVLRTIEETRRTLERNPWCDGLCPGCGRLVSVCYERLAVAETLASIEANGRWYRRAWRYVTSRWRGTRLWIAARVLRV